MIGRGRDSAPRHGVRSPLGLVAGGLLIGLLTLIGVMVLSTAGSRRQVRATPVTPQVNAASVALRRADAALRADQSTAAGLRGSLATDQAAIAHLRTALSTQALRLTSATAALKAAQANARCWHAKVVHPIRARRRRCAPIP